jgi:hypothetical protein
MANNHDVFYQYIQDYVKEYPECAAYISDYVSKGISLALDESQRRAADMEVIALVAMQKKNKNTDSIIKSKLETWRGKTSFNWDSILEYK